MAISLGDILTYNGSAWVNGQTISGKLGIGAVSAMASLTLDVAGTVIIEGASQLGLGTVPGYKFHVVDGSATFFFGGGTTATAGLVNSSSQQWSLRSVATSGLFVIRDDTITNGRERFTLDTNGNVVLGYQSQLSAGATNGFVYIPTVNGTPGAPATTYSGQAALVYDTSTNKLLVYNGGWKSVTLA